MGITKLYLFRITVHKSHQEDIFDTLDDKQEFLKKMISSHPERKGARATKWILGNYSKISSNGMYFRLGRISTKKLSNINSKGDFIENEIKIAPNSHCILDLENQVLAMTHNNELSFTIVSQGKALERIINENLDNFQNFVSVEIRILPDYVEFVKKIRDSYSVKKFWVKIRRPNPFDIMDDFVNPISKINNQINSEEIKVELKGEDLEKKKLESITGNTTIAGSEGGATIQNDSDSKTETIHLGKNYISVQTEKEVVNEIYEQLYKSIVDKYNEIKESFNINGK